MKTKKMYASQICSGYKDDLNDVIEYYFKFVNPNEGDIFTIKHADYIIYDASYYFNITDFTESLEEHYFFVHDPEDDYFLKFTTEQIKDLDSGIKKVIDRWAEKNQLQPDIGVTTNLVYHRYRVTCDGYELVSKV